MTVTISIKLVGRSDRNKVQSLLFTKHCASLRRSMDDVLSGSVWNTVGPMLDTDDVIRVRVAAKCWNDDRRLGKMGKNF